MNKQTKKNINQTRNAPQCLPSYIEIDDQSLLQKHISQLSVTYLPSFTGSIYCSHDNQNLHGWLPAAILLE